MRTVPEKANVDIIGTYNPSPYAVSKGRVLDEEETQYVPRWSRYYLTDDADNFMIDVGRIVSKHLLFICDGLGSANNSLSKTNGASDIDAANSYIIYK